MFRILVTLISALFSTIIFSVLAILASVLDANGNLSHLAARCWARSVLAVSSVRVTVRGLSNLEPGHSYIFMSNHQSNFDILVLLAHLKVQFRWLAKAELFKIPLFGVAMRRAGYISIDRSNRRSAFESLKRAAAIIREGTAVIIFPEGTRSFDGQIGPFKQGGFILALNAGVPIVPVTICGTRRIMPRNQLRISPGRVLVNVGRPIATTEYSRKTKNLLLTRVRTVMCKSLAQCEGSRP